MDISNLQLMNAAGWCKDIATVRKLAKAPVSEITVGSITKEPRSGNEGSVFWQSPDGTYALNSLGLPNPGIEYYRKSLPEMRQIAEDAGKGLRVSIAGFSPAEYNDIARVVVPYATTIEVNLGCPNVWGHGGQKPIASFEPPLMAEIVMQTGNAMKELDIFPKFALKVSPYSDPRAFGEAIDFFRMSDGVIDEIVTSNTFPNAFAWNGDTAAITPGGGFAGMSGKAMKAIVLGQAQRLQNELPNGVFCVIGVGGITSGADILDFVRAGITAVQIGTHYFVHGEKVFSELLAECVELA